MSQVEQMMRGERYWTARAMQEQGSRFFQALGHALEAADRANERRIYESWTAECWDFYQRGLTLAAAEADG
ncbi:hypothetical protein [Deinococcus sonorensis]|uniref:Uncharacterized protein n=2 Tax=Deinococcus sonorensis TaxID=309891 RepID=A0AAU7U9D4_9DEIO